jgi:hypothetical protein
LRLRWILGLIVLMMALALAACGGGGDNEKESPTAQREGSPAATKAAEASATAEKTVKATKTPATAQPSGNGGEGLENIPAYPGADKTGDYSGDYSLPALGEGLNTEDYSDTSWVVYETSDSVDDVAAFYKDKMPANGWNEEKWFDSSFVADVAWGSYTRDGGDTGAWVYIGGDGDTTQIVIGRGTK